MGNPALKVDWSPSPHKRDKANWLTGVLFSLPVTGMKYLRKGKDLLWLTVQFTVPRDRVVTAAELRDWSRCTCRQEAESRELVLAAQLIPSPHL